MLLQIEQTATGPQIWGWETANVALVVSVVAILFTAANFLRQWWWRSEDLKRDDFEKTPRLKIDLFASAYAFLDGSSDHRIAIRVVNIGQVPVHLDDRARILLEVTSAPSKVNAREGRTIGREVHPVSWTSNCDYPAKLEPGQACTTEIDANDVDRILTALTLRGIVKAGDFIWIRGVCYDLAGTRYESDVRLPWISQPDSKSSSSESAADSTIWR